MRVMLVCAMVLVTMGLTPRAAAEDQSASVVKIFSTVRNPELFRPWTKSNPQEATGSGWIIEGNSIITNAHVVSHAARVLVQSSQDSEKIRAEVVAIAPGVDLALLRLVDDDDAEAFFANHPPLVMDTELPRPGSSVKVLGFPMGGEQVSITEGVVSRVEFTEYLSDATGVTIQVDASINPGNSGGPAVNAENKVVGVVFGAITDGENIGYLIPSDEVVAFLEDVEDGSYEGRPVAELKLQTLENDALREFLKANGGVTGVVIGDTPKHHKDLLQQWDIITTIGEHDIDNAGLVDAGPGLRLDWAYFVPRVVGEDGTVPLRVFRDGSEVDVALPVTADRGRVINELGDGYPSYFVYGPLVFTPAYSEHVGWAAWSFFESGPSPLMLRAKDKKKFEDEQLVLAVGSLLTHAVSTGYEMSGFSVVKAVNGTEIRSLSHLIETLRDLDDDHVVFEFASESQETLVFDREQIEDAAEEILEDNGIRSRASRDVRDIWPED